MKNKLVIKGRTIGEGKPLICVPVIATTKDEIVSEITELVDMNVDMIEWRVDYFDKAESMNAIREVLDAIKDTVKDTILVYTYRSAMQGGEGRHNAKTIYDIRMVAAEHKVADLIDVEYFVSDRPSKEIKTLRDLGAHVIASHHDFEMTPEEGILKMLLEKMYLSGADIVKLAVMPQSRQDVVSLLNETYNFTETYPDTPIITMSMGAMGSVSRLVGEYFGSCVTFGSVKAASAPGQFPMDELNDILCNIHKNLEK